MVNERYDQTFFVGTGRRGYYGPGNAYFPPLEYPGIPEIAPTDDGLPDWPVKVINITQHIHIDKPKKKTYIIR